MTDRDQAVPHERIREELPELAADVLDGRARAQLLEHVDSCPSCAEELEELTMAVDGLVHLAVQTDPPPGFETGVFERMQLRPTRVRRHKWMHSRSLVAVAAAAVVLAFGLGWLVRPNGGPTHRGAVARPGDHPVEVALVSDGRSVGTASVYPDGSRGPEDSGPAWLSMSVAASSWTGPIWCTVTTASGVTRTVGSFSLTSGTGSWMARLPLPAGSVRTAALVDSDGQILATARFKPSATAT